MHLGTESSYICRTPFWFLFDGSLVLKLSVRYFDWYFSTSSLSGINTGSTGYRQEYEALLASQTG